MDKNETYILSRLYQSYVMGGDSYNFLYKTEKPDIINAYKTAIASLESKGLIEVVFQSDRKTRMKITDAGIEYGNTLLLDWFYIEIFKNLWLNLT